MKPRLAHALVLLAATAAAGQDPPKPPAPVVPIPAPGPAPAPIVPVASIVVVPSGPVAPGTFVTIDASASVGEDLQWDTDVPEADYREDTGHRLMYFVPQAPGAYPFKVDVASMIGGKIRRSKAKVTIVAVAPTPPQPLPAPGPDIRPVPMPAPPPGPAPLPAPSSPFQQLGRDYGVAQLKTYIDTWNETRTMLAAGSTRADLNASFAQRWQARRDLAFRPVAVAFAGVAPDNVEPAGPARDALLSAWADFVKGLGEAIR